MNNKNKKPKLSDFYFGPHSQQQLLERFKLSVSDVLSVESYFKIGNTNTHHSQVRNKLCTYPHQTIFYNEKYNLMFACDPVSGSVCTTMKLYPNQ